MEWDVMIMTETWVEEKDWEQVERRLPSGYVWEKQWARRENKKGRAIGGMLMGVRKGLELGEGGGGRREGIMAKKVKIGGVVEDSRGIYKRRPAGETRGSRGMDGGEGKEGEGSYRGRFQYAYGGGRGRSMGRRGEEGKGRGVGDPRIRR